MKPTSKFFTAVLVFWSAALAVNIGESAPSFSLATYGGQTFDLGQQKGKVTVLFFLGCT
jgi:hypothetical protein